MAQNIKRLSYSFYAYKEENENSIIYQTDFPFYPNNQLYIYSPVSRIIVDNYFGIDGNPSLEDVSSSSNLNVVNHGYYSSQNWFLGLSINGKIVHDGLFKIIDGIKTSFSPNNTNSGGSVIGSVEINKNETSFEIGILDSVEIVVVKSDTWAPWIYYGSDWGGQIGKARDYLIEKFGKGRNSLYMGGIQQSVIPAQAITTKYSVDTSQDAIFTPIIIPFLSSFFLPGAVGATSSSIADHYHTNDILNGNGELAIRSSTSFKVISQTLNTTLLGGLLSTPLATALRADAYRSINSRSMVYKESTYKFNNELLTNTDYFLIFEKNRKYKNMYICISEAIGLFINKCLDSSSEKIFCKFNFYAFDNNGITSIKKDVVDLLNFANELKTTFEDDSFYTVDDENKASILPVLSNIKNEMSLNFGTSISRIRSSIIFSGMNNDDDIEEMTNYNDELKGLSLQNGQQYNLFSSFALLSDDSLSDEDEVSFYNKAKSVFGGDNVFGLTEKLYNREVPYYNGFQFLNILLSSIGSSVNSESILVDQEIFDANTIQQMYDMITYQLSSGTIRYLSDYDGDNKLTYIDRMYYWYDFYNSSIEFGDNEFFGFWEDQGAEMRFWRNICPIGEICQFKGKIEEFTGMSEGAALLKINIVNFDEEGNEKEYNGSNQIYVYTEYGAMSNVSEWEIEEDIPIDFRGRILFPSYIKNIEITNTIKLADYQELSGFYRLLPSTSSDLLDLADNTLKDKPVVVVRSNIGKVDQGESTTGLISVSNIFAEQAQLEGFFKVNRKIDYVNDYVYITGENTIAEKIEAIVLSEDILMFESENDSGVIFGDIQFDISMSEASAEKGRYECEILYVPKNSIEKIQLHKFYSAVAFNSGSNKSTYNFNASERIEIRCSPSAMYGVDEERISEFEDRLWDIDIPNPLFEENTDDEFRYSFTWSPAVWSFELYINGRRVPTTIISSYFGNNDSEWMDIDFSDNIVNADTGQVLFSEKIDSKKNIVKIEFKNIAGNQIDLKAGKSLYLNVISGPKESEVITIENIEVNKLESSSKNFERVDCSYSSTASGDKWHLIAPGYGFVSLGFNGFSLNFESGTELASGTLSQRLSGDLVSPFLYLDAFADPYDIASKTIRMGSSVSDFPAVDVIHTSLPNTSTIPYLETRTVGYTPPVIETSSAKVDSDYSELTNRICIANSSSGRILNQKYSYSSFKDKDTDPGYAFIESNFRKSVPVRSGGTTKEEYLFQGREQNVSFSLDGNEVLTGLLIETERGTNERDVDPLSIEFSYRGEYKSVGYVDAEGDRSQFLAPVVYKHDNSSLQGRGHCFAVLPDTDGVQSVRISIPSFSSIPEILKVKGQFVDTENIIKGSSPAVQEANNGDLILFFNDESENQVIERILGLHSRMNVYGWRKPSSDLQEEGYDSPITIVTGFSNPKITKAKNDIFYLFLYDNANSSINLMSFSKKAFLKLAVGYDESTEENEEENGDEQSILKEEDENKRTWDRYITKGNHLVPVIFDSKPLFASDISKKGVLYLCSISLTDNVMNIRLNETPSGSDQYDSENNSYSFSPGEWKNLGINLLDEDSFLGKFYKSENFEAISIKYIEKTNQILIFISTENKLILYKTPRIFLISENTDDDDEAKKEQLEKYQEECNRIKPVLMVGKTINIDGENLDYSNRISEDLKTDFNPQIVSSEITKDGKVWIFYADSDGILRTIVSGSNGEDWELFNDV